MATTKIPAELSSTPGIVDNSTATAITIDSSENVAFAGAATFSGNVDVLSTGSAALSITSSSGSQLLFANTSANTASRDWAIKSNSAAFGDLLIQQETGFESGTFANKLAFSATGNATFSGAVIVNGAALLLSNDNQYVSFQRPTTGDFGYIGTALNTTGGAANDLGIRAENNLILGAGGYGADLTISSTGAATFSGAVGIGTSSTNGLKTVINGATGYPATSGTTQTGVLRLSGGTGIYNVLDMGVNESTDSAWIQATRANSLGTYDKLLLNPYGGNVGIGNTSPSHPLTVGTGTIAAPHSGTPNMVLIGGLTAGLTISNTSNSGTGSIFFGDAVNSTVGQIRYNHNTGDMAFTAEDDFTFAGGNVGIGVLAPPVKLTVSAPAADRETIRLSTYYSPVDNLARGGITWYDGAAITGQIDTRYTGTTVDMHLGSLYSVGYNTASRMIIKGSGEVTMPYQPAFTVNGSGTWVAMTSGTDNQVAAWGGVTQRGGANFVSSTGRFTAPVAGWYMFTFNSYTRVTNPSTASYIYIRIYKNGATYGSTGNITHYENAGDGDTGKSHSSLIQMAVGDYVQAGFSVSGTGCAYHHGSQNFSGYLVG